MATGPTISVAAIRGVKPEGSPLAGFLVLPVYGLKGVVAIAAGAAGHLWLKGMPAQGLMTHSSALPPKNVPFH